MIVTTSAKRTTINGMTREEINNILHQLHQEESRIRTQYNTEDDAWWIRQVNPIPPKMLNSSPNVHCSMRSRNFDQSVNNIFNKQKSAPVASMNFTSHPAPKQWNRTSRRIITYDHIWRWHSMFAQCGQHQWWWRSQLSLRYWLLNQQWQHQWKI